jgi:hypothetical protein
LLHSDASGEIHEPQWIVLLYRNSNSVDDSYDEMRKKKDSFDESFGEKAKTNFDYPK